MSAMLTPGSEIVVTPEKPVAGGRMLARHEGQVVLVGGAIPGERVRVRLARVTRQVSYGETVEVLESHPDRRAVSVPRPCGGALYAHLHYARQLSLKAEVIADAFARIGKCPLADAVPVMASEERGYRMRARLHVVDGRFGFLREGTHDICDAASTDQLLPATLEAITALRSALAGGTLQAITSLEVAENVPADQRAVHVECDRAPAGPLSEISGITGLSWSHAPSPELKIAYGSPCVVDALELNLATGLISVSLQHHVRSFFQANRWLLGHLVTRVLSQIPAKNEKNDKKDKNDGEVVDLYAGVGLFAVSLAASGRRSVIAVEGDRSSASDLAANAATYGDAVDVRRMAVEEFVHRETRAATGTVLLDPPRTGISREAMSGLLALNASRIVYVSCDVATLARDLRRFLDEGYRLEHVEAFDLFPNTAHVETLVTLTRGG